MEEYVVADLVKSNYIVNAAVLDQDGFIIAAMPDDEKTKQLLSRLAEVQYVRDNASQTTIIAEKMSIIINQLVKKYALVVGCESNSNLGFVRQNVSIAVARLNGYLQSKKR